MLDRFLGNSIDPVLGALAQKLGLGGMLAACLGLFVGLAGLPLIGFHYYLPGLAVLVASRLVFALAIEGDRRLTEVLKAVSVAGYPFAFALAAPEHAASCAFLMFGLTAAFAAGFAYPRGDVPNVAAGAADIIAVFALALLVPGWFGPVAYAAGVLFFVAAGQRIDAGRRA
jgi:hypothetical protein